MALSRRQVLALGSLSALVAGLGGAAVVAQRWWDPPAADGFAYLAATEAAFIRALAGAAYPATASIPHSAADLDLDHFFDAALRHLPPDKRTLARVGLHALDAWPLATMGASFVKLSASQQAQVVDSWRTHARPELRQAASSLLVVAGMGFCTHPTVAPFFQAWHRCGYGR